MRCPPRCFWQPTQMLPYKMEKVLLGEGSQELMVKWRKDCWHWFPQTVLVYRCVSFTLLAATSFVFKSRLKEDELVHAFGKLPVQSVFLFRYVTPTAVGTWQIVGPLLGIFYYLQVRRSAMLLPAFALLHHIKLLLIIPQALIVVGGTIYFFDFVDPNYLFFHRFSWFYRKFSWN